MLLNTTYGKVSHEQGSKQIVFDIWTLMFQFKEWQRRPAHSKHIFGTNFDYCSISLFRGCICLRACRFEPTSLDVVPVTPSLHSKVCDAGPRELSTESQGTGAKRSSGYNLGGRSVRRLTEKWPHPISATLAGFSLG